MAIFLFFYLVSRIRPFANPITVFCLPRCTLYCGIWPKEGSQISEFLFSGKLITYDLIFLVPFTFREGQKGHDTFLFMR